MGGLQFLLVLQLCTLLGAQRTNLDNPFYLQLYSRVRSILFRAFVNRVETRRIDDEPSMINLQDEVPPDVPFPCNVTVATLLREVRTPYCQGGWVVERVYRSNGSKGIPYWWGSNFDSYGRDLRDSYGDAALMSQSAQVPTSVNRLRPGDIDIIGGIGDSLTAGNAIFAKSVFELGIESRGASGSSGGQGTWRTYTTLPNILKEYNPKLIGYALGDSYVTHRASEFDVAEAGSMSRDMPFMAEYLVDRLRKDPRVDIKKHWKMITLMIGSNDFCTDLCAVPSPWSILDDHKKDLIKTLRILRDNLPRTFVGLILPPHLRTLVEAQDNTTVLKCYLLTRFECPCLFGLQFRHMRAEYYEIINRWLDLEKTIADYPEFDTDDFTVVPLPSLQGILFPKCKDGNTDPSYFAFDCFHVTQKTNALYGNALWNNLLEPYGNKSDEWQPLLKKFLCPTAGRPFLMTRGNSRKSNDL